MLKHKTDFTFLHARVGGVFAVEKYTSGVGLFEPCDHAQQRGFT
jgi:hypothetical protein